LPFKRLLPQFPLIIQKLALATQLPSQVLNKDVSYGKIIQTHFSTQPLKMLPGFPVPIPGIVVLTAASIFPAALDSYFLKILHENPPVISHEVFQSAGLREIQVCPVCCPVFGWRQWHLFDYVLGF
jgi:hypothetical protein